MRTPAGATCFRPLEDAASRAEFGLALLVYVLRKCLRECQRTPHQGWRPTEMPGDLRNGLRFPENVHDLPDGDTMPEHISFAPARRIPKTDSRKLLLQRLLFQVKTA